MKYYCIFLGFCMVLFACEQEANLAYPTHQPLPVLNGILQPDSAVQICLTQSVALGKEAIFPPIAEASVELFEDGQSLGMGTYKGAGKYRWDYKPLAGKAYRVTAAIPHYSQIVSATDTVPTAPQVLKISEHDPNNGLVFQFTLQNRVKEPEIYWFTGYYTFYDFEYDFETRIITIDSTIRLRESFSDFIMETPPFFIDDFNRWFDNIDKTYVYNQYLRMDDDLLNESPFDLEIGTYQSIGGENTIYHLVFIHASPNYDKYLKSSLLHYFNTEESDEANPISAPVRIYSNIQNGLGIFAACNTVKIELEKQ